MRSELTASHAPHSIGKRQRRVSHGLGIALVPSISVLEGCQMQGRAP